MSCHRTARLGPVAVLLAGLLAASGSGCATARYSPRLVARGELTLDYQGGFSMQAGGATVAKGPTWGGLPEYVRCVPRAHELATAAQHHGRAGVATQVLGATLGVLSLGGFYGLATEDTGMRWAFLGGGVATALVALGLSIASVAERNGANGRAVDAMNFYNDSVGSLGASCDDLTYPYPLGAEPPAPTPAPPAPPASDR